MMLALTFGCRALLVFLLLESGQTDRTALLAADTETQHLSAGKPPPSPQPFLITENMWPRGCVLDCQRGHRRAVCGSNGRLYKSLCAFQRAQCINTQLRLAPMARCSDPTQSKCQVVRTLALEANAHNKGDGGHVGLAAAIFVPECHPDGHFLPVQCHNQTRYCWCSTPDGELISGTSVLRQSPNCTDHMTRLTQVTDADAASIQGEVVEPDSRKPAEPTAPPFWVTILMNSDPKGSRSVRRPTVRPQMCEHERASLLSQVRSASRRDERFVPECTADGRYRPVQCHAATGYCWCVRADSGRPLPGTSARNHIPDCTGAEEPPPDKEKPLPGCPGARKKHFLQSLVRALQLEAEHAGSLSPNQSSNAPTPSSTVDVASPTPLDAADSSRPDVVLQWHFSQLDVDSSGSLSEREARPLRQFLRRRLKPRRCAKKFAQYCDRDGDRGLTLEELRVCLGL